MKTKDIIRLTISDMDYLNSVTRGVSAFNKRFIALDEYTLYLKDPASKVENRYDYKWDWLNETLTAKVYQDDGSWLATITASSENNWDLIQCQTVAVNENVVQRLKEKPKEFNGLSTADMITASFLVINIYLCSVESVEAAVERKTRHVAEPSRAKGKTSRSKRKVYLLNEYVLRPEYRSVKTHAPHTFHCPAWGVRGHYRHYKDGRTVFIKPYVKGKKKTEYKGKEYVIAGEGLEYV